MFWTAKLQAAWRRRTVVWLSGVRRAGKTCLCQALPGVEYFDCELPRVRRMVEDPESFLDSLRGKVVALDEVHRLGNPSEVLKVAADHYPDVRVIATGSSALGASTRFRDTLAGRKAEIWLTPIVTADMADFGDLDLKRRFLHGGLPPFFLQETVPEHDFQEWMDAYWAKGILELFRLERRYSFMKFAEMLFSNSGGIFEASRYARPCEISRATVANYLSVLEATYVVHVVKPFSSHRASEIVSAPKVYAFDTGFVCHHRGWDSLRAEDKGLLWEHLVLNDIQGLLQTRRIQYWRDKRGHEVDFVFPVRQGGPIAVECKWTQADFDARNLNAFRRQYPEGENLVVSSDVERPYRRAYGSISVHHVGLPGLIARLGAQGLP